MTPPVDDERPARPGPTRPPARGSLPGEVGDALPVGSRLHEFQIVSVIGQGGFGIVYLAHDLALDRRVAIKEYMPSSLAMRTEAMTVEVRSTRHAETFAAGLRSFVNEGRLLAQFDHPSLLKVHRFWEAHGTAYLVMPYYAGITFARELATAEGPPDEARLRALIDPLLDALGLMHAAHCYHRDIAPDNILLLEDGTPLLLDFGAARRVIGDMTQALTVILKSGYAPIEQYGGTPELAQGPWTDLYALGSVVEFAITGRTPPQAVTRLLNDKREPLARRAAGRYGDDFLRAIDRSLAVLPKDRPQSVAALRALLGAPPKVRTAAAARTVSASGAGRPRRPRLVAGGAVAAVVLVVAGAMAYEAWTGSREVSASAIGKPTEGTGPALKPETAAEAEAQTPSGASAEREGVVGSSPEPMAPRSNASPVLAAPPEIARPTSTSASATTPTPSPMATREPTFPPAPRSRSVAAPTDEPVRVPTPFPVSKPTASTADPPAPPPARKTALPTAADPLKAEPPPAAAKKPPHPRCAEIVQRVSLGEPLTDGDKTILTRECKP